ncbi:hypothetical protein L484_014911 [Morus notabilis]|uniref:Uncharacterized protein n=1 Tax=Morus notabilis TaxID=981085 RepID=W9RMG5_9ROSA|nr:hypothetical protein L484_014911 [Morus notabilis]
MEEEEGMVVAGGAEVAGVAMDLGSDTMNKFLEEGRRKKAKKTENKKLLYIKMYCLNSSEMQKVPFILRLQD